MKFIRQTFAVLDQFQEGQQFNRLSDKEFMQPSVTRNAETIPPSSGRSTLPEGSKDLPVSREVIQLIQLYIAFILSFIDYGGVAWQTV